VQVRSAILAGLQDTIPTVSTAGACNSPGTGGFGCRFTGGASWG